MKELMLLIKKLGVGKIYVKFEKMVNELSERKINLIVN